MCRFILEAENVALTFLAIKNLKPREKPYRLADSGGLCIEVMPSGSKLWRWRYKLHGKSQLVALGKFPDVTLEQARKKRDETRALVMAGKNPAREKKAQKLRTMHEGDNTFEKVARRCLEVKQANMNEKYRVQCLARMEQHVFPLIGDLPIAEITIPDIVRVLEKIGQRGTIETAKRMKQLISQTFRYAAQRARIGLGSDVPPRMIGPVRIWNKPRKPVGCRLHHLLVATGTTRAGPRECARCGARRACGAGLACRAARSP